MRTDYTENRAIVTFDFSAELEEIQALFAKSLELESKLITLNRSLGSNRIYTSNKIVSECLEVIS